MLSEESRQKKLGLLSASRAQDIIFDTPSRNKYLAQIAEERKTGKFTDRFTTNAMRRGRELEEHALSQLANEKWVESLEPNEDVEIKEVAEGVWVGATVDAKMPDYNIEIKVPVISNYPTNDDAELKFFLEYAPQLAMQQLVTGKESHLIACKMDGVLLERYRIMTDNKGIVKKIYKNLLNHIISAENEIKRMVLGESVSDDRLANIDI